MPVRLRWALGSWSNAHFDHGLYPLGSPRGDRLERYARRFDAVEADILHHRRVDPDDLAAWARQVPARFRFLPKMHKDITHRDRRADAAEEAASLHRIHDHLGDRLGPCLLQFPKSFTFDPSALAWLQRLLGAASGRPCAVELRHASWWRPEVQRMLEAEGAALVWGTFPGALAPAWATADFGYIRLVGTAPKRRGRWVTSRDRTEDLLAMRDRMREPPAWRECTVVVTNRFEGNALDALPRAVAALEGPQRARAFVHQPGRPLLE